MNTNSRLYFHDVSAKRSSGARVAAAGTEEEKPQRAASIQL